MALSFRFFLSKDKYKHMTWTQRLMSISMSLNVHLRVAWMAASVLFTISALLTGTPLVYWADDRQMRTLLRLHSGIILVQTVRDMLTAVLVGYRPAVWDAGQSIFMVPCLSLCLALVPLPTPVSNEL